MIVNIDFIIFLLDVLDEFGKFQEDIKNLVESSKITTIKEFNFQKIYRKNLKICKTINSYSKSGGWRSFVYIYMLKPTGGKVKLKDQSSIDYIYKYLMEHKSEKEKILTLLKKIKSLGLDHITLNKDAVFTNKIYEFLLRDVGDVGIREYHYLANIEIPSIYQGDRKIKYITNYSPYDLILFIDSFYTHYYSLIVNSLTFDPNLLPNTLKKEDTFDKIIELRNKNLNKIAAIDNAIDLRRLAHKMQDQLTQLSQSTKSKVPQEVLEEYGDILNHLLKLAEWYDEYANKETGISKESLEEQLQLKLKL